MILSASANSSRLICSISGPRSVSVVDVFLPDSGSSFTMPEVGERVSILSSIIGGLEMDASSIFMLTVVVAEILVVSKCYRKCR